MNYKLLFLACVPLFFSSLTIINAQLPGQRPNIILIVTDDQSAVVPTASDGLLVKRLGSANQARPFGFNGDGEVYTPFIDSLARQGMVFNRAYVSSSVCAPSRYSMLTGRYASRSEGSFFLKANPRAQMSRVENNTDLEKDRQNLPKRLQQAGYTTGFVGKSHIVGHELLHGPRRAVLERWQINSLKIYDKTADPKDEKVNDAMASNHKEWANRIKAHGFDYANGVYAANLRELFNDSLNVHNVEWKNKAALDFIDQAYETPFFLYYSETLPHGPVPWEKRNGKLINSLDANPKFTGEGYVNMEYTATPKRQEIKEELKRQGKDMAHAWLRWFDHSIAALVRKLKEKGVYDNTLIVITSDHGNFNFGKTTLYESGTRVPLMMHWPNGIKKPSVYNELVQNIDFAPTFQELAQVNYRDQPHDMDGVSLVEVLRGSKEPVHDHLYFEIGFSRAVMTKDWKYIAVRYDKKTQQQIARGATFKGWKNTDIKRPYYVKNKHLGYFGSALHPNYFEVDQLFHLKEDTREKRNVFQKQPVKAREMQLLLTQSLRRFPQRPYGEFVSLR